MKELPMTKKRNWRIAGITAARLLGVASFWLVSHGRTAEGEASASSAGVEVANVEQKDIPIYHEWIGTLDGLVNAVRSQVAGYLLAQNYSEGSLVKKARLGANVMLAQAQRDIALVQYQKATQCGVQLCTVI
jgi:hypothetical protein